MLYTASLLFVWRLCCFHHHHASSKRKKNPLSLYIYLKNVVLYIYIFLCLPRREYIAWFVLRAPCWEPKRPSGRSPPPPTSISLPHSLPRVLLGFSLVRNQTLDPPLARCCSFVFSRSALLRRSAGIFDHLLLLYIHCCCYCVYIIKETLAY